LLFVFFLTSVFPFLKFLYVVDYAGLLSDCQRAVHISIVSYRA